MVARIPNKCILIACYAGANVAKYSSQNLSKIVIESDDFKKGEFKDALQKGFLKIDEDLRAGKQNKFLKR